MSHKAGDRRRGREFALQVLFQLDLQPQEISRTLDGFWPERNASEEVRRFADRIVRGTMAAREAIDAILSSHALNWRITRMAVVDRNILRIALYEFLFEEETPRVVIIDEAIEIAKRFGNDESGPFINGILDAVRIKLESGEIEIPESIQQARDVIPERSPA